jgi:hypothetical protein
LSFQAETQKSLGSDCSNGKVACRSRCSLQVSPATSLPMWDLVAFMQLLQCKSLGHHSHHRQDLQVQIDFQFTNVHQCSPMFTILVNYLHQGCMGWHQIGCRYWSALTRHFSWLLRLSEAVNPVKFIPIRIPSSYEPISHLYVLLPNFCADLDSQ